jgi:ribosomal protein S17E
MLLMRCANLNIYSKHKFTHLITISLYKNYNHNPIILETGANQTLKNIKNKIAIYICKDDVIKNLII